MSTPFSRVIALVTVVVAALSATRSAAQTAYDSDGFLWNYVGSFDVYDGPDWTVNPPIYSGIMAAELVFGAPGLGSIYAISVDQTLGFVTHTAVYDGWGVHEGTILAEDFFQDVGGPGYNDPYGGPAYSAYVHDGGPSFTTPNGDTNYVWVRAVDGGGNSVPDGGSSLLLALMGFGALAAIARKR